jgi:hypothetical protein
MDVLECAAGQRIDIERQGFQPGFLLSRGWALWGHFNLRLLSLKSNVFLPGPMRMDFHPGPASREVGGGLGQGSQDAHKPL